MTIVAAGMLVAGNLLAGQATLPASQAEQKGSSDVVATYADGRVTAAELSSAAGAALTRLKMQAYDIKVRTLKQMIFNRLLEEAAARAGKTRAQFFKEQVTDNVPEPPKERVDELLKRFRSQLKGTDEEARRRVVEALKRQQRQRLEAALKERLFAQAGVKILINPPRLDIRINADDPVRGPVEAPVTIVEFSDFQCPYCARVQPVLGQLLKKYPSQVRLVFKNSPLPMHHQAKAAAEAALCAGEQGKFWEMHDWLYAHQADLSGSSISAAAAEIGLDADRFSACVAKHGMMRRLDADMKEARQLGVNGTPTFFVNGRMLRGAQKFQAMDEAVRDELGRLGIAPAPAPQPEQTSQKAAPAAAAAK